MEIFACRPLTQNAQRTERLSLQIKNLFKHITTAFAIYQVNLEELFEAQDR